MSSQGQREMDWGKVERERVLSVGESRMGEMDRGETARVGEE